MSWIKILGSVAFNMGIPIASWFAVTGSDPAGNVVKLIAAVTAILCPLVLIIAFLNPGKPVGHWREYSSHISDITTIAILVWHGWLWCSLAFTMGWFCCLLLFTAQRAHTRYNQESSEKERGA